MVVVAGSVEEVQSAKGLDEYRDRESLRKQDEVRLLRAAELMHHQNLKRAHSQLFSLELYHILFNTPRNGKHHMLLSHFLHRDRERYMFY